MIRQAFALLLLMPAAVHAQRPRQSAALVSLTETAARLAESGAARGDAHTVMVAGEILRVVERGATRVQRMGAIAGPPGSWDGPMTSAALFQLASRIASERGDLSTAGYIAWLAQLPDSIPAIRGATGGPVWADTYLGRGQEAAYSIDFTGGQTPNALRVSAGKAGAVFECVLLEGGNPAAVAARVRSIGGTCSMEWRQSRAGRMTLRIRNAGATTYVVVSTN